MRPRATLTVPNLRGENSERHPCPDDVAAGAEDWMVAHAHERVIIVAPVGRDAAAMAALLDAEGFGTHIGQGAPDCCQQIAGGAGVLLLTEEALELPHMEDLMTFLKAQPPWSELPLIILTSGGESRVARLMDLMAAAAGTVTLLERPLNARTLIRSVDVALRSRRRQYQVRDLLEKQERDRLILEERAHHQQSLYTLVDALTRAASIDDVFEAALSSITTALRCDRAAILLGDDQGIMRFTAWRGLSAPYRSALEGHSPWPSDDPDPQPLYFVDVATAPFEPRLRRVIQDEGVGAVAFFPLQSRGELIGKFVAYYDAAHAFGVEERQLAQAIALHLEFGIERKRTEEALRESEVVLRTVTTEAQVGLAMISKDRHYLFANQTYAEILGLPGDHIIGRSVPEVLHEVHDQIGPRLDRAFAGERVKHELRLAVRANTREERVYEVVYEPRTGAVAEPYVVMVIVDVTERKKMQQTLEHLVEERTARLRETIQELEAFSYSIAHDMRAPLRGMRGFANILQTEYAPRLDATAHSYCERIIRSAQRMDALIVDILNYGKVVRGDLELRPIRAERLIHDIVGSYPALKEAQAEILVESPLPIVLANEAALTQVMSNLLGNAVKFVAPEIKPRVRVWGEVTETTARLWFEDNGIGIPKESQPRLFNIFTRLHRPELYEGTGIGLAIVRKAAERMGGRVGVESEPGQGSRFWIELKAAAE